MIRSTYIAVPELAPIDSRGNQVDDHTFQSRDFGNFLLADKVKVCIDVLIDRGVGSRFGGKAVGLKVAGYNPSHPYQSRPPDRLQSSAVLMSKTAENRIQ